MKNMKKILVTVVAALLLMTVTVMGTLAYLTSTSDEVKNTFTVGQVKIKLDEADVDENGDLEYVPGTDGKPTEQLKERVIANSYKLMPGHDYKKDPIVYLEPKSEPSYLFVKVVNGIAGIEAGAAYTAPTEEGAAEPADSTLTIAGQMEKYGWKALGESYPNIYYYETVESNNAEGAEDNKIYPVFTTFKIKDNLATAATETEKAKTDAEVLATYNNATVTIKAFAIQEDGFETAAAAWDAFTTQHKDWDTSSNAGSDENTDTLEGA